MRAGAVLALASCLYVSHDGDVQQLAIGETHVCKVERYCGGIGAEDLGEVRACHIDTVALENHLALECWSTADECQGGFCNVTCEGTHVACFFFPDEQPQQE